MNLFKNTYENEIKNLDENIAQFIYPRVRAFMKHNLHSASLPMERTQDMDKSLNELIREWQKDLEIIADGFELYCLVKPKKGKLDRFYALKKKHSLKTKEDADSFIENSMNLFKENFKHLWTNV